MNRRWLGLTPLALLAIGAGCAHRRVSYVAVREVHEHLEALRAHGVATVDAVESDDGVTNAITAVGARRHTVALRFDREVTFEGRTATLRQLAEGCPNRPPAPGEELTVECGLFIYGNREFEFSRRSYWDANSYKALATGLGSLAALGGAIYCGRTCTDYPTLKTAGLGVSSLILILASALYSGGRD